jgi:hypothetical protein
MIVVRYFCGAAGRMRESAIPAEERKSWPNLTARLTSNSTSSLPFEGKRA